MNISHDQAQALLEKFLESSQSDPFIQIGKENFMAFDSITLHSKNGLPKFILQWNGRPLAEIPVENTALPKNINIDLTLGKIFAIIPLNSL